MKRFFIALFVAAMPTLSCVENLPPYVNPNALGVELDVKYVFTNSDNSMWVDFVVTNHFDETLQSQAAIQGEGKIMWSGNPTHYRSFALTALDVVSGYDPATGVVTIDPGKSIRLRYKWDFVDENGADLKIRFTYYPDPTCNGPSFFRKIAYSETFIIDGSVKIFERIPMMNAVSRSLSMCYVSDFVLSNYCVPIDPTKSCKP